MSEYPLQLLTEHIQHGRLSQTKSILLSMHPAELAQLLEALPVKQRHRVWALIKEQIDGTVLAHLNEEVRNDLIQDMDVEELAQAANELDTDDMADLLQDLPDDVIKDLLDSMDATRRGRLETILSYPEDSAGGLMNLDAITVRSDVTLSTVLRYLRIKGSMPAVTDSLFVINRNGQYQGTLSLSNLLTNSLEKTVDEVMSTEIAGIPASSSAKRVARLFEQRDLLSAPVVDDNYQLLGRITVDDVLDLIMDEAEHSFMGMAGMDETEDMFAPTFSSAARRAVWLGINLATAFVAAIVINKFDVAIEQIVALAVLMPIVPSMGGIAGGQTLTLMIRSLALGQVTRANTRFLLSKEVRVGLLNGIFWALIVGLISLIWFQDLQIAAVIGAAMIVNMTCGALAGVIIPITLKNFHIDPALAGNVILTTATDVIGYATFLGLATYLIL